MCNHLPFWRTTSTFGCDQCLVSWHAQQCGACRSNFYVRAVIEKTNRPPFGLETFVVGTRERVRVHVCVVGARVCVRVRIICMCVCALCYV